MPLPRLTLATIVATVGPASESVESLQKLIEAGVGVFRLNFSHGTLAQHKVRLDAIRTAATRAGLPIAVLGDLCGPKIRIGQVREPGIELHSGQDVILDATAGEAREPSDTDPVCVLPCSLTSIARDVQAGQRVLINDGNIRMLALGVESRQDGDVLRCRVTTGGLVTTRKGLNLPDSKLSIPAITPEDWASVEWAVDNELDFLALSFVRSATEVRELQQRLEVLCSRGAIDDSGETKRIPVVAKMEKPEAIDRMDEIVQAADAIMVARGDLGVEMDLAQVPIVQKRLIQAADAWGKPCIVATQMLESMITSATPTRAEATDVANAVLDGADAVMLSGETAVGRNPCLVVETMRRIIVAAEAHGATLDDRATPPGRVVQAGYRTAALAHGAWHVSRDVKAKLIVCWSQHGGAARYLSQTGFDIPIIAYSSSPRQTRRMALLRGVWAMVMPIAPGERLSLASWNAEVDRELVAREWAKPGDAVVLVAGEPLGVQGATNTLAVHYVGNPSTGFMGRR